MQRLIWGAREGKSGHIYCKLLHCSDRRMSKDPRHTTIKHHTKTKTKAKVLPVHSSFTSECAQSNLPSWRVQVYQPWMRKSVQPRGKTSISKVTCKHILSLLQKKNLEDPICFHSLLHYFLTSPSSLFIKVRHRVIKFFP